MRRCLLLLMLVGCDAGAPPLTGPRPDQLAQAEIHEATTQAQREIDGVAKAVLESYIADPTTVPDSQLLDHEPTILLERELERDGTGAGFTADALPAGRFAVRSSADMQADADATTDRYVHYIFIHDLRIEGSRAKFWVGVHVKLPNHPEGSGTCCCSAEKIYEKRDGTWRYAATTVALCS